jgi:hypothetical protein
MIEQLTIEATFDAITQQRQAIKRFLDRNGPVTRKFWEFHNHNPDVYHRLRDMARQLKRAGHQHYGIRGLFEVLRWEHAIKTFGSEFKLNNNYTALYARALMLWEDDLWGFFRLRDSDNPQVIE